MATKKNENYRDRKHCLLLYPDDSTHVKALETIKQSYDYALCLHDKDVDEDGVIKKAHWHVVLKFTNQVWKSALAKELGIQDNYIEQSRSLDNSLEYLIHFNDSDKYQYNINDVTGTLAKRLKERINTFNKSEGEKVYELIEYIDSYDGILRVTEFSKYCALNGYWAEFRRSGAIFCKMIDEHNQLYKEFIDRA